MATRPHHRLKTFGIHLAESGETIARHSAVSGIPAGTITGITQVIGPLTATG